MKKQMIKRKDGSYSQRGLWDNIRANRGSGKKPTAEMLKQEKKIKANMADGGINNPGFKALPGYVQAKIRSNMQMGGMSGSPVVDMINQSAKPAMMQVGGMMPQTSAGQSVLQEAMMMNQMQDGGKMPNEIARARFMAAAKGNVSKAKETASKYGYKMQGGGGPIRFGGGPVMDSSKAGFDFSKASAAAVAQANASKEEVPTDIERMAPVDIKKKRSFADRIAGNYRKAKRALGLESAPKTEFQQNLSDITKEIDQKKAAQEAATKKANRNYIQKIGDEFPTYLNLSSNRNVVTDLADMGSLAAVKLGMPQMAVQLQQGKQAVQEFGKSDLAAGLDYINPLSIGANIVGGAVGTAGDIGQGETGDAATRLAKTSALALTKGAAGRLAGAATSPVGKGISKIAGQKIGTGVGHQAAHAGQHAILSGSGLIAHKNGGTIKDMYMMKKGGQFPERYKKMGFSGVDKPKRTTTGPKSHAVVTKVDGNYKLIRFGQQGEVGSPDGSARNKAFKARHAKNIAKGKSSAAYWANKVKW